MNWIVYSSVVLVASLASASLTDERLCWAHYVGWEVPENVSVNPQDYYAFPVHEIGTDPYREEVRRARMVGLDGFFVDVSLQYKWRPGYYYTVENLLKGAEGTSFKVAPCLDVKTDVTNQIANVVWMLKRFGNHPNYPRVDGRYVVATYTYHEWTPAEWRRMLDGCAREGCPVYMIANMKPSCGLLEEKRLANYRDVFDCCYSFAYTGREQLDTFAENAAVGAWCRANGRLFMPCIHHGYVGSWLKGHNSTYIPFQGVDHYLNDYFAGKKAGGQWLHFTSWNDHVETTLAPMLLTGGNAQLLRATCDDFKGVEPSAEKIDVLLAYRRENLPGTLLRIEALRLPAKECGPAEVGGVLLDARGMRVAELPVKKLAAGWDRAEWLVPSVGLAKSPHLTPVLTLKTAGRRKTASFSPIYQRTPWIENQNTVRETFAGRSAIDARFGVTRSGAHTVADLAFTNTVPIRRAILFRNDRPVGQFAAQTQPKGWASVPLRFSGICDFELRLAEGRVVAAKRAWGAPGIDGFKVGEKFLVNHPTEKVPRTLTALLEGPDDAEVVLTDSNGTNRWRLADLPHLSHPTASPQTPQTLQTFPDCTLRNAPTLDRNQGAFRLELFDREPQATDAYFVRLECADGTVAETETLYPFSAGGAVKQRLLETTITLDTYPGEEGTPRVVPDVAYREYLTPADQMPVKGTTSVVAEVARESLRSERWPLRGNSFAERSERYIQQLGKENFARGPDGRLSLKMTETDKIKLPIRMWPMDVGSISVDLAPEVVTGAERGIFTVEGSNAAFSLRILADGRLEATWSGVASNAVWQVLSGERHVLRSQTPLTADTWLRVRLENDNAALRLFLNGRLEAELPYKPFRAYSSYLVFLGTGYRGFVSNLQVGGNGLVGTAD